MPSPTAKADTSKNGSIDNGVNVIIKHELPRPFVGFVAAVGIDMDIHVLSDHNVTDCPFIYVSCHRLGAQVGHLKKW